MNPIYPYRPTCCWLRRHQGREDARLRRQPSWGPPDFDSLNHYPTRFRRHPRPQQRVALQPAQQQVLRRATSTSRRRTRTAATWSPTRWRCCGRTSRSIPASGTDCSSTSSATTCWSEVHGGSINIAAAGLTTHRLQQQLARRDGHDRHAHAQLGRTRLHPRRQLRARHQMLDVQRLDARRLPFETGGTWYTNMFWRPGGYMTDRRTSRAAPQLHLHLQRRPDWTTPTEQPPSRAGASAPATMGDGFGVFGGLDRDAYHADWWNWWFDEYAGGSRHQACRRSRRAHGWLGQPLTRPCTRKSGCSQTNRTASQNSDFRGQRRPTLELLGELAGDDPWDDHGRAWPHVRASTSAGTNSVTGRLEGERYNTPLTIAWTRTIYSVTFWARRLLARRARDHRHAGAGAVGRAARVGGRREWRACQIPFNAQSLRRGVVQFYLAQGDRRGLVRQHPRAAGRSPMVYRDFQNGTVLVNPSEWSDATVHSSARTADPRRDGPVTNDGSVSANAVMPGASTLFLARRRRHAPAQVVDLRAMNLRP